MEFIVILMLIGAIAFAIAGYLIGFVRAVDYNLSREAKDSKVKKWIESEDL